MGSSVNKNLDNVLCHELYRKWDKMNETGLIEWYGQPVKQTVGTRTTVWRRVLFQLAALGEGGENLFGQAKNF